MTLYTPRHFAAQDRAQAFALIDAHPFATLITAVDGAEPAVTHLPLLREGEGALVGHMARVNPQWRLFSQGRTLAVFHGPHAYVSPRWYQQPHGTVPTWNYATVHVQGAPSLIDGAAAPAALLQLTQRFDPELALDADVVDRLLPGIVAFRMPIQRLDAKFKMNQNKTAADRASVIEGLLASGAAEDAAVATWMQAHD